MSDDTREFEQQLLDMELSGFVEMYAKTGNAVFIWQAYQLCREWGAPVREDILQMFDRMAAELMKARTPTQQLGALRLTTRTGGGGEAAAEVARRFEAKQLIAWRFAALRAVGRSYTAAVKQAALDLGCTAAKVKKAVHDWERARPKAARRRSMRTPALEALPRRVHRLR